MGRFGDFEFIFSVNLGSILNPYICTFTCIFTYVYILSTTKVTVLYKLYPLCLLYLMRILLPLPLFLPPLFLLTMAVSLAVSLALALCHYTFLSSFPV